jgi:hypothetical protein
MKSKAKVVQLTKRGKPRVENPRNTLTAFCARTYYRSINWAQWWDEFIGIKASGRYNWRRTFSFILSKTKKEKEREFLFWYLGPPVPEGETSPYPWVEPQNWIEKRRTGGWFTNTNLRMYSVEIRRRMNALEALREAGNGITLHSLVRAEQLAQELDRSFKGQMFIDSLGFTENVRRTEAYIGLHQQLLALKGQAQELYAKSHGVDFNDMAGLVQLISSAAINGTGENANSREKAALNAVVEMALTKAQKYSMDLPAGAVEVMGEAVVTVDENDKKRRKVQ